VHRTELEAALQASWNRETLDVYADTLQADGDPRGALIAMALAGTPDAPRLRARREQLVAAWVGDFVVESPNIVTADTGFITASFSTLGGLQAFMRSHLAPYLRRVDLWDPCNELVVALATAPHRWCADLGIGGAHRPVDIVAHLPSLTRLRLSHSTQVVRVPPSVKRLELGSGTGSIEPFVHVEELALCAAFDAALVHPWLRLLDLGDGEERNDEVFALCDQLAGDRWPATLRLPSLRTATDVKRVRAIITRRPAVEIEIARSHRPLRELVFDHPRVRFASPVPCPPSSSFAIGDQIVITFPGQRFELMTANIAANTEWYFAKVSSEQQAALSALWTTIPALTARPVGFPGAAMERVAETIQMDFEWLIGTTNWEEVRRALAAQQPCTVMLSRHP